LRLFTEISGEKISAKIVSGCFAGGYKFEKNLISAECASFYLRVLPKNTSSALLSWACRMGAFCRSLPREMPQLSHRGRYLWIFSPAM